MTGPVVATIRTDAGARTGYGHVRRSLALASALRGLGVACRFAFGPDGEPDLALAQGFAAAVLPDAGWRALAGAHDPLAGPLVVDTYGCTADDIAQLSALGGMVAVFDDGNRLGRHPCRLVTDASPGSGAAGYGGPARLCLGPSFACLGPGFAARAASPQAPGPGIVAVTFGGSDPDDCTLQAVRALENRPRGQVRAILGAGYRGRAAGHSAPGVVVVRDPQDMAEELARAEAVISGAGVTALELACLGVPALLVSLGPDQEPNARSLEAAGCAVHLGGVGTGWAARLPGELARLLAHPDVGQEMSARGRALVDGLGAGRLARAVLEEWTLGATHG